VIIRRSTGVIKQGGLSRSGVGCQECLQECKGKDTLPSGGLDQAGKDTLWVFRPFSDWAREKPLKTFLPQTRQTTTGQFEICPAPTKTGPGKNSHRFANQFFGDIIDFGIAEISMPEGPDG